MFRKVSEWMGAAIRGQSVLLYTGPGRLKGSPTSFQSGFYSCRCPGIGINKTGHMQENIAANNIKGRLRTRATRRCAMDAHEGRLSECLVLILGGRKCAWGWW